MTFDEFLRSDLSALAEGAVLERVRRDSRLTLDPHILNGGFIYDAVGREVMGAIHRDYMRLAREAGLPLLAFTDTWRCSRAALDRSLFKARALNEDHVRFLQEIRAEFGEGSPMFIGGLIGPSADAYQPQLGLRRVEARDFHRPQVMALASAQPDFLHLATGPNVEEALGAADVMGETALPYVVSFVIRRTGVVLDGTPLEEAIARIDAEAARAPVGYSVNCVHAAALEGALSVATQKAPQMMRRLIAFQANTADCEVEDIDESAELVTEEPGTFADQVERVQKRYHLRVVGGCCGTDSGHIGALAKRLCVAG